MSKSQSVAPEGRPTHGVKIRVRGVEEGSVAHQKVLDSFHGRIGQVLRKNQQQVALSGHEQYASITQVPGGTIHYKNNQGHETVTVDVETLPESQGEEQKVGEFYDWALIEIELPNMTTSDGANFAVIMERHGKDPSWAKFKATNSDDNLLRFADAVQDKQLNDESSATSLIASLLVDLRQFKHPGSIKINVYGFALPTDGVLGLPDEGVKFRVTSTVGRTMQRDDGGADLLNDPTTWPSAGSYTIEATADEYALIQKAFPEYASVPRRSGGGSSGVFSYGPSWNNTADPSHSFPSAWSAIQQNPYLEAAQDPNVYMSTFAATRATNVTLWSDSFGVTAYTRMLTEEGCTWSPPGGGSFNTNAIPLAYVTGQYSIQMYDYKILDIPRCTIYEDRPAKVRAIFFKGGSPDACSYWALRDDGHFQADYYQWESSKIYPNRWNMPQPLPGSDIEVVAQDYPAGTQTVDNHFLMPALGVLTINPSVEQGGFKFVPA